MRTMKNFLMLGILPLIALAVVSCGKDPDTEQNGPAPTKDSVIKLESETVSASYGGGSIFVTYEIENPHQGEKITVKPAESWVTVADTSLTGAFQLSVAANDTEGERQSLVTVSYRYAEDVTFIVKQHAKLNATFTFENVSKVDEYFSYTVDIYPTNKQQPYIVMSADVFYLSEFPNGGTDQELSDDDWDYFGYLGAINGGLSALEVAQSRLKLGDNPRVTVGGATPGMKCVFYAYYVDATTGARISDVSRFNVTIAHPQLKEVEFEFDHKVEGPTAWTKAEPTTELENYYFDVISEYELDWAEKVGGFTKEEYIKVWWAGKVVSLMNNRNTVDDIIADSTCVGTNPDGTPKSEYFYELAAGVKYYLFAFEMSSANALCVSTPKYVTFTSGYPEKSDNKIEIKVSDVSAFAATFAFTASNDDRYVAGWETADNWATYGRNDAERMEYLISNIAYEYIRGDISVKARGLLPETDYVVYAFGMHGGISTTDSISTATFTTSSEDAGKLKISLREDLGYYEPSELAEYDKWSFMSGSDYQDKAIVPIEVVITTHDGTPSKDYQTFVWDVYNWEGRNDEYNDQQYIDHLIYMIDHDQDTGATYTYTMVPWENRVVYIALVVDEDDNFSKLYKWEIRPEHKNAGDAQVFVDWWTACEEDQGTGLQSLVIEEAAAEMTLFRDKVKRFRASEYDFEDTIPAGDVDYIPATR